LVEGRRRIRNPKTQDNNEFSANVRQQLKAFFSEEQSSVLGVKKRVDDAAQKLTSRFRQSNIGRRLADPNSQSSFKSRGVEWLYLLVFYLLVAGVINAISNAGTAGINVSPIVASSSAQNVAETFIIMFGYIIGSLGAYALYLSGRQTIRARSAEIFFVGGVALMAIAITLGYYVYAVASGLIA
jgi:hypothetical protein